MIPTAVHGLSLVVSLLGMVVMAVVFFRLLHLPAVLGYLTVGVLIGPFALGWLGNTESITALAEFGVVLLMFTIGLEFSLPKLLAIRRMVFGVGAMQVIVCVGITALLGWVLGHFQISADGMSMSSWIALGGILAMSSTAILLKMLTENAQLDSGHGRIIFGILLFQDLAVVPLLILIPALAQSTGNVWLAFSIGLAKTAAVLAVLLGLGQKPMRRWLKLVAKRRSHELFMLNVFLMTLGFALLTEEFGLSLALGAFVAGMLIAETEYKEEVEENIMPFKDMLLGFFFVTIGMSLDIQVLWNRLVEVLLILLVFVAIKVVVIGFLAKLFRASSGNAFRSALALAPAGEFGLVLLGITQSEGLLNNEVANMVKAAMLVSMFSTPLIIKLSDRWVYQVSKTEWMSQSLNLTSIASQSIDANGHVLIAGFSESAQSITSILQQYDIQVVGIDNDPEHIKTQTDHGFDVVSGDITHLETLHAAGAARARALIITVQDQHVIQKVIGLAKEAFPKLPLIVRTSRDDDLDMIKEFGADYVISDIQEGAISLASQTLSVLNLPQKATEVQLQRHGLALTDLSDEHAASSLFEMASLLDAFDIVTQPAIAATAAAVDTTTTATSASATTSAAATSAKTSPVAKKSGAESSSPEQPSSDHVNKSYEQDVVITDNSLWSDQKINTLPTEAWRVTLMVLTRDSKKQGIHDDTLLLEHDVITFKGRPEDVDHACKAINGDV